MHTKQITRNIRCKITTRKIIENERYKNANTVIYNETPYEVQTKRKLQFVKFN